MDTFGNVSRKASLTYPLPQDCVRGEYNKFTPIVEEIDFIHASSVCGQQEDGECSKAKEAHEGVLRNNFITSSLPQACEVCVHEEYCKSFTPTLQEDSHKHATNGNGKQEDVESSKAIVGILKRSTTSSNSPPQEGDKGECARYTYAFNEVYFNYDKHGNYSNKLWRKFACSFCGLNNHTVLPI